MRRGTKGFVGWLAIVAIALHAVLWGAFAPMAASAAPVDPFSVICHSGSGAPSEQGPQMPGPASACDHCTLCGAAAPPFDTIDNVVAGQLLPAKLLDVLRPAATASRDGVASTPHQARGPPHQV
jgi:hypothetical protein